MEFYSAMKKNEILSFAMENIILGEVRLGKPKIVCSPSYADFRSKANVVILIDMGHILRGECIWEE
jgi:hypothetical protein